MAAPMVAGQAALIRALNPQQTTAQVVNQIINTAAAIGGAVPRRIDVGVSVGVNLASAAHIETTGALKQACETSPGNVVVLSHNTKISNGQRPPATETVATGCTLQLEPFVKVEMDQIALTFNGPFTIIGSNKANLILVKSALSARVLNLNLGGGESLLIIDESKLQATSGDANIMLGALGKIEIKKALMDGSLAASNEIMIAGGDKFSLHLSDAILNAGSGIRVDVLGTEVAVKANKSSLTTSNGGLNVNLPGNKGLVEMGSSSLSAGNGVKLMLGGSEAVLKLTPVTADGGAGDVRLKTGAAGETKATESRLTSATLVRIAAGVGGKCESLENAITAPVRQICP